MSVTAEEQWLLALVDRVLGDRIVGIYRHGSATLGGSRPGSDVDVLAVTAERLADAERRTLVDSLLDGSAPPGTAGMPPLELTIVVQADVRPWRFPPVRDFQWGEWLRGEHAPPGRERDPDLALLLAHVRAAGVALRGPEPATVLDAVPATDAVRAMAHAIPQIAATLDEDPRHGLLTLARIWHTLATGAVVRKDEAADWAAARLRATHRRVLEQARLLYLEGAPPSAALDPSAVAAAGSELAARATAALRSPKRVT